MHQKNQNKHSPVLLEQVLEYLQPKKGEAYLDLTAGYGGHAKEVLKLTATPEQAVLVDRDENAINHLRQLFEGEPVRIIHEDFLTASRKLKEQGKKFDLILADLGVSSPHLDKASRGFSFQQDGPLDMRMDNRQSLTAEEIVNNYSEERLSDLLKRYGEEPKARSIAARIVANRPVDTTQQLAKIVASAWPGHSRTHPATRTFQALRLAVNSELELLEAALPIWGELLKPGGRLVVISFHSLEDRKVKRYLAEVSGNRFDAEMDLLTAKPVTGDKNEIVFNPRARSAKLRAAVKIKNQKGENANADSR